VNVVMVHCFHRAPDSCAVLRVPLVFPQSLFGRFCWLMPTLGPALVLGLLLCWGLGARRVPSAGAATVAFLFLELLFTEPSGYPPWASYVTFMGFPVFGAKSFFYSTNASLAIGVRRSFGALSDVGEDFFQNQVMNQVIGLNVENISAHVGKLCLRAQSPLPAEGKECSCFDPLFNAMVRNASLLVPQGLWCNRTPTGYEREKDDFNPDRWCGAPSHRAFELREGGHEPGSASDAILVHPQLHPDPLLPLDVQCALDGAGNRERDVHPLSHTHARARPLMCGPLAAPQAEPPAGARGAVSDRNAPYVGRNRCRGDRPLPGCERSP